MKLSSLSILIPAYRDQDTIATVVKDAVSVGRTVAKKFEIVVINDASPDRTGAKLTAIAKKIPELRIVHHSVNAGYGGTIKELYYSGRYEWLFTVPGDNQYPVKEIVKMIPFTKTHDMIIGWRTNRHDPPARLRQSKIYNTLLRILFGRLPSRDVNSIRLMRSDILHHIKLTTTSAFVDAELVIRASWAGYRVVDVPIIHKNRLEESGAGGGSMRTILPTVVDMVRFWFAERSSYGRS